LNYEKNRNELTELGQQFGIVTRNTSLIVLETVDDYIRYKIEPPAELRAEYQRVMKSRGLSDGDMKNRNAKKRDEIDELMEGLTSGNSAVARGSRTERNVSSFDDLLSYRSEEPSKLRPSGSGVSSNKGGGDPRARVTQMGVLGIVSEQVKGKRVASADIFGKGGLDADIDEILSGVSGLRSGSDDGGVGRKGTAGIGYGSGFGGSGGDLELKKKSELNVSSPDFLKSGVITGGRSRASIKRIIMQNMPAIRYAYHKRLREKPDLCGKITVKLAIDEFGKVIFAQAVESTIGDSELESTVVARFRSWNFEKIDKPGDITEVTYPFIFSNDIQCKGASIGSAHASVTDKTTETAKEKSERQARERAAQQAWEKAVREAQARETVERAMRERAERKAREQAEREALARKRAEIAEQRARERAERRAGRTLNDAVTAAQIIKSWWNTDFTRSTYSLKPKYPTPDEESGLSSETMSSESAFVKSTDYLQKMTGKTTDDYQTYLSERTRYANSPTFYFNMASWFYAIGDKETAIRVLTSIADLELENAALYRLLGYRFKEFGEYALEKFVCKKVVMWRPMEPQSYRDYALALADNGEAQAALNWLYGLLTKTYSENIRNRSVGIEEVVVTEINRLIAKNPGLNTSKVYKPLKIKIPVDVRVVINWNMNSTDIDLHIVDPTGEECDFSNRKTNIGGRMSADIRDGYGPEQFLLKKAAKGKYKVYVNYYGDRQVTNAGPSTVMAEIYTKYADKTERRKVVCLQMSNARINHYGNVLVAEFEI